VKVCSLYGAGFYYIPGTDVCLKLGGFLRTEWNIHANGSFATFFAGGNALQTRTEDNYITRARGYITTDVREQTSYGTLRAYLAAGWQFTSDDSPTISLPGTQATASSATTTFTTGGNSNLNWSDPPESGHIAHPERSDQADHAADQEQPANQERER